MVFVACFDFVVLFLRHNVKILVFVFHLKFLKSFNWLRVVKDLWIIEMKILQAFLPVLLWDLLLTCFPLLNKNIYPLNCIFHFFPLFWEHFEICRGRTLYNVRERRRWGKEREEIILILVKYIFSFGSLLNTTNNVNLKAKEKLLISERL